MEENKRYIQKNILLTFLLCFRLDIKPLLRSFNTPSKRLGLGRPVSHPEQRISDPTLPGRSYHLDLCHQVPESDITFLWDGSRKGRKGRFEQTRARYCEGTAAEGRAGRRIDPSPWVWRATRSGHWRWITSSPFGRIGSQARAGRGSRAAEAALLPHPMRVGRVPGRQAGVVQARRDVPVLLLH